MAFYGSPLLLALGGYITEDWIDYLWQELAHAHRARPIVVDLNSEGGDYQSALSCFSLLRQRRAMVTTVAGRGAVVHSGAALVYSAGDRRIADVSTSFLIHRIAQRSVDRWTASNHRAIADYLDRLDHGMIGLLAERCGRPRAAIERLLSERPFTALSAQDCGLVTEIEW